MSKPTFKTLNVTVAGVTYACLCRIVPARAAAHVGADSPRFLDCGHPGSLTIIRVLKGAVDVTDALDRDLTFTIQQRCCMAAGVKCATMPEARDEQLTMELGGVR